MTTQEIYDYVTSLKGSKVLICVATPQGIDKTEGTIKNCFMFHESNPSPVDMVLVTFEEHSIIVNAVTLYIKVDEEYKLLIE